MYQHLCWLSRFHRDLRTKYRMRRNITFITAQNIQCPISLTGHTRKATGMSIDIFCVIGFHDYFEYSAKTTMVKLELMAKTY